LCRYLSSEFYAHTGGGDDEDSAEWHASIRDKDTIVDGDLLREIRN
jgi:hypothetical protein